MASLTPAEEIAELKTKIRKYEEQLDTAIEAGDNEEKKRLEGIIKSFTDRLTGLEADARQQPTAGQQDILRLLVPVIKTISENLMVQNNPWTESKLSKGERALDCRERLRQLLKFSKNGKNRAKCCVTGMRPVICAHLIPCSATSQQLKTVGLTVDDVNSTRNLVFWLDVIEHHFDRLQLSFMRTNPLVHSYFLKIWDNSIRGIKLGSGLPPPSPQTVGDIEGFEMTLSHPVYTRLLAYQAYQCCVKYRCDDNEVIRQSLYGSPGNYPFRTQSELLLADFHKIVAEEIDVESDQDEEDRGAASSGNGDGGGGNR